jgi:hypothetical protein
MEKEKDGLPYANRPQNGGWPYTFGDDWCGEFHRALDADLGKRKKAAKPKKAKRAKATSN